MRTAGKSRVAGVRDVFATFDAIVEAEAQDLLGWRDVPVDEAACGPAARAARPHVAQVFVGPGSLGADRRALERRLYVIRKRFEHDKKTWAAAAVREANLMNVVMLDTAASRALLQRVVTRAPDTSAGRSAAAQLKRMTKT